MKKYLYLISFLLVSFFCKAQNVPNGGFENWVNHTGWSNPVSWNTTDSIASTQSSQRSVLQEQTIIHGGASAMKMQSWVYSFIATEPGAASNGTLNASLQFEGGTPDTVRHDMLSGWYVYSPDGGDSCSVYVLLTKWNGSKRDTIGQGLWNTKAAVTSYTQFNLKINYALSGNPDTVLIVIASAAIGINSAHAATILYMDDLDFSGITSTNDLPLSSYSINAYPNPASGFLTFESTRNIPVKSSIVILDMNGKLMGSAPIIDNKQQIDISSFSNGNYFYEWIDEKGTKLYSGKFSISH